MSFFKRGCRANALQKAIQNIQLLITAGAGAGSFKWEDMDATIRMGKIVELKEKNKKNLNCVYKDKKNEDLINQLRNVPLDADEIMKLSSEMVYLAVIAVFIKEKDKENPQAKLGGRRRRRTKKRKSRRRRRKRTKKKRRRKSRRRRRR